MKKTLQGFLRKPVGIIAAAVLAIAMIAGTAAVADFTLSHRAKRVIAAYESGEKLFSSNYLRQGTDSRFGTPVLATIYVDASEQETGSITETVSVCNYVQGNHNRWFDRNIPYTLRAQIVELEPDPEHDGKLRIKSTTAPTGTSIAVAGVTKSLEGSGVIQSFSKTLASDAASADTYTVSFPASMLQTSQYYLWLEATPQDGLGLDTIAVLLNVQRQQTVTLNNWTLEQRDDTNNSIGQYSGFNYQLYGTGKGSMTLAWDPAKLVLDKYFIDQFGAGGDSSVAGQFTFPVDSDDQNSYDIRFYRVVGGTIGSWSDVAVGASGVSITFTETAPSSGE